MIMFIHIVQNQLKNYKFFTQTGNFAVCVLHMDEPRLPFCVL